MKLTDYLRRRFGRIGRRLSPAEAARHAARSARPSVFAGDNVFVRVHSAETLADAVEAAGYGFESLPKPARYYAAQPRDRIGREPASFAERHGLDRHLCRDLAGLSPTPDRVDSRHNVTCAGLHEYFVDNLDPNQAVDESAEHLAVGSGTTAPATSDTALTSEEYRTQVTDTGDQTNDWFTSTFLDTSEANGVSLEEVGLFTASTGGTLLNHSLISTIAKTNQKTATIDVTLEFRSA